MKVRPADLWELTKPGITGLVLATTAVGFYLGVNGSLDMSLLLFTLVGTALLAAGANALNHYAERDADALMKRTRDRPLPARRLEPWAALVFAVTISAAGTASLWLFVNPLTAVLGLVALLSYIFAYTPLKSRTSLCTIVGAVPGAIPPMMGWTAVRGELDVLAWVLFSIVFLWQLPHFLAIAWLYRGDYERAGLPMLPVVDPEGTRTAHQIILYSLALLTVSLLTTVLELTGALYFFGALTLGIGLLALGVGVAISKTGVRAKRLFLASVLYLPILLVLMIVDKV
ncbi:MAG: heme o synthase [Gemmatimonadota bacterium]|nr:heme o synthase [Candidatus Palauibacterales bacterium]